MSQANFGKILGVSMGAVINWEKAEGTLNMREPARKAYVAVRGLGAREAKARLDGSEGKTGTSKVPARAKNKGTVRDAVQAVLKRSKKPMSLKEITAGIRKSGYKFASKNPEKALGVFVYTQANKKRSWIKKAGRGLFALTGKK